MPKPKVEKADSAYKGVNNYSVNMDGLATASANKAGKSLVYTSALSAPLQGLQTTGQQGLQASADWLARDPSQQLADLGAGKNEYYNLAQDQAQKQYAAQMSALTSQLSRRGGQNSTTLGSAYGQLADQQLQRDMALRTQALDYLNQRANQSATTQGNILQMLAGFQQYPLTLGQQGQQAGFASQDAAALANAQAQNAANMARYQQMGSIGGNLIGAGLTFGLGGLTPMGKGLSSIGRLY